MDASTPTALRLRAADGYELQGLLWRHGGPAAARPIVVINAATSVRCDYYRRFAGYLFEHGSDVLTYDYRGIGASRRGSLRGFEADWLDWGQLDCEAALQYALREHAGQPLQFVGHSVGGFLAGLAPSNAQLARVFTVGAQFAYWPDYLARRRAGMLLKWHLAMPLLTRLLGYFPGQRLGWLEDTPRGVVRDWIRPVRRFEDVWARPPRALDAAQRRALTQRCAALRAPILALSLDDDEFGTAAAVQRLLNCFPHSPRTHLHLAPADLGVAQVGHFAFFHARFAARLWPVAREWLRDGRLTPEARRWHQDGLRTG